MAGPPPPALKSLLGRHRLLAPSASVYVSPLALGGMSLGTNWKQMLGACTKENAFELLDTYYDLGGNFIDTANAYQGGQSEQWIGEWMAKTGRRSEMVIATKYSMNTRAGHDMQQSNFGGNGTKSLHLSVQESLKNLQTDYIDLFYVHFWDFSAQIPEVMQSLNNLVRAGKVLYLGISDVPAWVVVKANAYARQHGLRPFSVYQGQYSALMRDLEREIIPMCRDEDMAICAFGALGRGYIKSPDSTIQKDRNSPQFLAGTEEKVSLVLDKIAKRLNVPITNVALAYVLAKTPYMFPLIGGFKIPHLRTNVESLSVTLSPDDTCAIDAAYDFKLGFPHDFLNPAGSMIQGPQHVSIIQRAGHFDYVQAQRAIAVRSDADVR